jgi:hypothetical protein
LELPAQPALLVQQALMERQALRVLLVQRVHKEQQVLLARKDQLVQLVLPVPMEKQ